MCSLGGTASNDKGMIKKGISKGHSIEIITPQYIKHKSITDPDLVILSNIMYFPKDYIEKIMDNFKVVTFNHDYNFCNHRLYYPMREKCKDCINKPFWEKIFKKSKLNIFLSPLHYEAHKHVFSQEILEPRAIIPSCLDVGRWKPIEGVKKEKNTVVGINCLLPFKGRYPVHNYAKNHPDYKFTFIGEQQEISLPNCEYVQYVPNEDMAEYLQKFEYFIHLPDTPQPFERTCAEAYLSGLKMIKNENIGFFSYPWDYKDREDVRFKLRQAAVGFWDEIDKVL